MTEATGKTQLFGRLWITLKTLELYQYFNTYRQQLCTDLFLGIWKPFVESLHLPPVL